MYLIKIFSIEKVLFVLRDYWKHNYCLKNSETTLLHLNDLISTFYRHSWSYWGNFFRVSVKIQSQYQQNKSPYFFFDESSLERWNLLLWWENFRKLNFGESLLLIVQKIKKFFHFLFSNSFKISSPSIPPSKISDKNLRTFKRNLYMPSICKMVAQISAERKISGKLVFSLKKKNSQKNFLYFFFFTSWLFSKQFQQK